MRLRTEALGGYDLSGLILGAIAILGLGIAGAVMLIIGVIRQNAGRSAKGLFIGGLVLMIPGLWVLSQIY